MFIGRSKVFFSLLDSVIFKNIPLLLDTSAWPKDDSVNFGDKKLTLTSFLIILMSCFVRKNGCDIQSINKEWICLKLFFAYFAKQSERILFGGMVPLICQHRANVWLQKCNAFIWNPSSCSLYKCHCRAFIFPYESCENRLS